MGCVSAKGGCGVETCKLLFFFFFFLFDLFNYLTFILWFCLMGIQGLIELGQHLVN